MKKGNIFMLAYSFILIVLVLVDAVIKQGITTRIAIAAALASYFFAFADLFALMADRNAYSIKAYESRVTSIDNVIDTCKEYVSNWRNTYAKLEGLIESISDTGLLEEIPIDAKRGRAYIDDIEKTNQGLELDNESIKKLIAKKRKKESRQLTSSAVLMFLGFVLFFLTAFVTDISRNLESMQNVISVCAFAIVIQCYEAKDRYKADNEEDEQNTKKAIERAERLKGELEKTMDTDRFEAKIASLQKSHESQGEIGKKKKHSKKHKTAGKE